MRHCTTDGRENSSERSYCGHFDLGAEWVVAQALCHQQKPTWGQNTPYPKGETDSGIHLDLFVDLVYYEATEVDSYTRVSL
jgi:hypothetical protein